MRARPRPSPGSSRSARIAERIHGRSRPLPPPTRPPHADPTRRGDPRAVPGPVRPRPGLPRGRGGRVRRERPRPDGGRVHGLLPVRLRRLAGAEPPAPRRVPVRPVQRAPRAEPGDAPRHPREGGRPLPWPLGRHARDRGLLRGLHGRGGDRGEGPASPQGGARADRPPPRPGGPVRGGGAPPRDRRLRPLRVRVGAGLQGLEVGDRQGRPGRAGPSRARLLPR